MTAPPPKSGQPPPNAARIAEILRSTDPWPKADGSSVLDLTQRIVTQQRHMLDYGPGLSGCNNVTIKSIDASGLAAGLPMGAAGSSVDMKVSQLAERVSVLLAGAQCQSAAIKQDLEQQLDSFSSRIEGRLASVEARLSISEDHSSHRERQRLPDDLHAVDTGRVMREVRALVDGALAEVQGQWRSQRDELIDGQQEQARQLEELGEHTKRGAARMQEAQVAFEGLQHGLDMQAETLQRTGTELRNLVSCGGPAPWYGELEACVVRLEHRVEEQRSAAEHQLGRFRSDTEGLRLRLEGLREDALCAVDRRIDQEMDRVMAQRPERHSDLHTDKDHLRRLDEFEARFAGLKVRIDAHDDRFGALGERTEAACSQALDSARQAAAQHKEEILQEIDCQLSIFRQRMEAVGEICEELALGQTYQPTQQRRQVDDLQQRRQVDDRNF